MDKTKTRIEKFLLDNIRELEGYIASDEYDETEKHDCNVTIEAYREVLAYIHNFEKYKYITCFVNGKPYEASIDIIRNRFGLKLPHCSVADINGLTGCVATKIGFVKINGSKCQEFNTIEDAIVHEVIRYLDEHNCVSDGIYEIAGTELWKNII